MPFWKELLALILVPTSVIAAVAYLIQTALRHGLSRDLERFKTELERSTQEHLVRFSLLHERRADAIAQLHIRLVKLRRALNDLTGIQCAGTAPIERKAELAARAGNEAQEFFECHRIYFENSITIEIEEVLAMMRGAFIDFDVGAAGLQRHRGSEVYDSLRASAGSLVRSDLPPLMTSLEESFRQQLSGLTGGSPDRVSAGLSHAAKL